MPPSPPFPGWSVTRETTLDYAGYSAGDRTGVYEMEEWAGWPWGHHARPRIRYVCDEVLN